MKQSDPLELVDAGPLVRPGPVGGVVRLMLGAACLYAFFDIVRYAGATVDQPFSNLDNMALLFIAPLCVFNYVVNIGFSKSWSYRPIVGSLIVVSLSALVARLISGSFDHPIFGVPLVLWLGYFYAHLGISFVLSALTGTPGCEMRSIPEVFGRMTGQTSEEHHCPAAFITKVDAWEQRRAGSGS